MPQRGPERTVRTRDGDSLQGEPGKDASLAAARTAEGNSQAPGLEDEWENPGRKRLSKEGAVGTGEGLIGRE